MYLLFGVAGYIACCIFDINKIKWHSKHLNILFLLGMGMILCSTVCGVLRSDFSSLIWPWSAKQIIALAGLIISILLLIYIYFFALPFGDTYTKADSLSVIDRGVYGLCRHPGFWGLLLFYLFLWLFFGNQELLACFFLYNACNYIYIFIQDRYIFPQYIQGYDIYKRSVPFLIPNGTSLRNAFRS